MIFNYLSKSTLLLLCLLFMCLSSCKVLHSDKEKGLKDYYKNYFPIGVAINANTLKDVKEVNVIRKEFNSITAENEMKMSSIAPKKDVYNWKNADALVNFAGENKMKVRGHTLLWHKQTPDWMFLDDKGKQVTREVLLNRLRDYIFTVMTRYKGKVYAWDVVNEAIDDNKSNFYRKSKWLDIIGEDYIEKAFEYAHEADPKALLFYNDYNTEYAAKRDKIYQLIKKLKEKNIPINGLGLQAHWSIFELSETQLRKSIELFSSLGIQLHFTELDVSIYKWEPDERKKRADENDKLTPELEEKQAEKYAMFFKVFREYQKNITSVTFWNLSDRYSWLDDFPIAGRKNYPTIFDANLIPKKSYYKIKP